MGCCFKEMDPSQSPITGYSDADWGEDTTDS